MASYRPRVDPQLPQVNRRVTAAPVDTYVRPGVSQGEQLAQALAQIEPSIGRFSETLLQRYNAQKKQEGIAYAREAAARGETLGDLTREGALPMQENEWFRAGLQEEMGRIMAGRWRSDFVAKLANDPEYQALKESTSLEDFDAAVEKHRAEFLEANAQGADEFFRKGFLHYSTQYIDQARLQFAYGIEGKLAEQAAAAIHGRVMQIIEDDFRNGVDNEVTAASLERFVANQVKLGQPADKAEAALIEAIEAAARAQENPEDGRKILALFGKVRGKDGYILRHSKYGAERLEKVENDLRTEQLQNELRAEQERQRAEQREIDEAVRLYGLELERNPEAKGTEILRQFPHLRGKLIPIFASLSQNEQSRVFQDNEYVYQKMLRRVVDPEERVTAVDIAKIGGLTPETKMRLINMLDSVNAARGSGIAAAVERDPAFREELALADNYFKRFGFVPNEETDRVGNLKARFRYQVYEMAQYEGLMEKSPQERAKILRQLMSDLAMQDPGIQAPQQNPVQPKDWSRYGPMQGQTPASTHPRAQAPGGQPQRQTSALPHPFAHIPLKLSAEQIQRVMDGDYNAYAEVAEIASRYNVPGEHVLNFVLYQQGLLESQQKKE